MEMVRRAFGPGLLVGSVTLVIGLLNSPVVSAEPPVETLSADEYCAATPGIVGAVDAYVRTSTVRLVSPDLNIVGTGFFHNGIILTNAHIIQSMERADRIAVQNMNGAEIGVAEELWRPSTDLPEVGPESLVHIAADIGAFSFSPIEGAGRLATQGLPLDIAKGPGVLAGIHSDAAEAGGSGSPIIGPDGRVFAVASTVLRGFRAAPTLAAATMDGGRAALSGTGESARLAAMLHIPEGLARHIDPDLGRVCAEKRPSLATDWGVVAGMPNGVPLLTVDLFIEIPQPERVSDRMVSSGPGPDLLMGFIETAMASAPVTVPEMPEGGTMGSGTETMLYMIALTRLDRDRRAALALGFPPPVLPEWWRGGG